MSETNHFLESSQDDSVTSAVFLTVLAEYDGYANGPRAEVAVAPPAVVVRKN